MQEVRIRLPEKKHGYTGKDKLTGKHWPWMFVSETEDAHSGGSQISGSRKQKDKQRDTLRSWRSLEGIFFLF